MVLRALTQFLGILARAIVKKYQPRIVGITGSVGKTTTRAACVAVLSSRFRVRGSDKNYNNELGVPITIIGVGAPGSNIFLWLGAFARALRLLLWRDKNYPELLVLELGADHPGDIAHLLSIAPLDVGVVTAVAAAHTEFFKSVAGVLAEKKLVLTELGTDKNAVVNVDDENVHGIIDEIRAPIIGFGFNESATVRGVEAAIKYDGEGAPIGTQATIKTFGQDVSLFVQGVLGRPCVYAALAAAAVGRACGLDIEEIQLGLSAFQTPPGRLRIISGIKKTILIDDTYNASPNAAKVALDVLKEIHVSSNGRRIAVLGDMLELGELSEQAHREIGRVVIAAGCDILVTVGAAAKFIADEARVGGMDLNAIFSFDDSVAAGEFLKEKISVGDIILVKGSQGARCEKIVKLLMADPAQAEKILVRQGKGWK
ncbi:MAG: Mur ligase family protein [Candidatus Magasanikbacteria bacterium]|nr:Mur ligase family protein [Candidatus Magasanikbacteria bacterium]